MHNVLGDLTMVDTEAYIVAISTVPEANGKNTYSYDGRASRTHPTGRLTEWFGPLPPRRRKPPSSVRQVRRALRASQGARLSGVCAPARGGWSRAVSA
jgi:hypothetical protein